MVTSVSRPTSAVTCPVRLTGTRSPALSSTSTPAPTPNSALCVVTSVFVARLTTTPHVALLSTRLSSSLGGLKVGYYYNWWDDGLSGEVDSLSSNATRLNAIRYTYDAGSFYVGVAVEELDAARGTSNISAALTKGGSFESANNVGVSGIIGANFGAVKANLLGGYDTDQENGAIRAIVTADIGPGTFGISGIWASGANNYYEESEWTVAAEYAIKATDKLTITPGAQYFSKIDIGADNDFVGDRDAWRAGVAVGYKITQGLSTLVSVNYQDVDGTEGVNGGGDSLGWFRSPSAHVLI